MSTDKKKCKKLCLNPEHLLIQTQIEAIRKEVELIKEYYFSELDYDVVIAIRSHTIAAEDAEMLEEKYEIYKDLYVVVVTQLMQSIEERTDAMYPECREAVMYVPEEPIDYDNEPLPF